MQSSTISPEEWPHLSRLLDEMLDLPPEKREAWMTSLRGEDGASVPRLRELLVCGARQPSWYQTLPNMGGSRLEPTDEQPGEEVGPYTLVRLLGRGGMASVWYAKRRDHLVSRGVALKLPLGRGRHLAARFAREREIVARLVHPNIARLYDAGISAQGQAYFALEFVAGTPLNNYCDQYRLGIRERVRLCGQVLDAVQYAHSSLVIHRDLKPSNILVADDGQVRLLDFGVAKLLGGEGADQTELTRVGGIAMTLAYASPEQVAGKTVSTATDIYSLGVLLYELLAGVRPYRVQHAGRGALEEAILRTDIRLPSAVPITAQIAVARSSTPKQVRRDLRGDLDAIILRAMNVQPEQRYTAASAMADDLRRYLDGHPVAARRPSRWYELRKFTWRNRLAVAGVAVASLALVVALGVALRQARLASERAILADRARDNALAAANHRQTVDDFMYDLLLETARTGSALSVPALVERADKLSESEFANNPEARAAILKTVGDFQTEFKDAAAALPSFRTARDLLATSADERLRSSVGCSEALLEGVINTTNVAVNTLRALGHDTRSSPESASECLDDLAQLLILRNDGRGAAEAADDALRRWQETSAPSPLVRLKLLTHRAQAMALNGQPATADEIFARVLIELRALGRDRGVRGNIIRDYRIYNALNSGDLRTALAQVDEQLAIVAEDDPQSPPPILPVYERGEVNANLGHDMLALRDYAATQRLAAANSPTFVALSHLNGAAALSRLGRTKEAEAQFEAGALVARGLGGQLSVRRTLFMARAKLDLEARRYREAQLNLDQALQIANLGPLSDATIYRYRALARLGQSDWRGAVEDAQVAAKTFDRLRGDHPRSLWVGQAELTLGRAEMAGQDHLSAMKDLSAAIQNLEPYLDGANRDLTLARTLYADAVRGNQAEPH
jgi:serine/threonine protein kinase